MVLAALLVRIAQQDERRAPAPDANAALSGFQPTSSGSAGAAMDTG